jgi:hypothetical protein
LGVGSLGNTFLLVYPLAVETKVENVEEFLIEHGDFMEIHVYQRVTHEDKPAEYPLHFWPLNLPFHVYPIP